MKSFKTILKPMAAVLASMTMGSVLANESTYYLVAPVVPIEASQGVANLSTNRVQVEFGDVALNAKHQLDVDVVNRGTKAVKDLRVTLLDSSGVFLRNTCGLQLAPDANCKVMVWTNPTEHGDIGGLLVITGAGDRIELPVTGWGGLGILTLSAYEIDFGDVPVGAEVSKTLEVSNTGPRPLPGLKISTTGSFSATHNCPASLTAGGSCTVKLAAKPESRDSQIGALQVQAGDSSKTASAVVYGLQAELVGGESVFFGSVHQKAPASRQTLIRNVGNHPAEVNVLSAPATISVEHDCGNSLAAGAACTVTVTYNGKDSLSDALVLGSEGSRVRVLLEGTRAPDIGFVTVGGAKQWADGTLALSCEQYKNPAPGYEQASGYGAFRIQPAGHDPFNATCDQDWGEGGWTLAYSLGTRATSEAALAAAPNGCDPMASASCNGMAYDKVPFTKEVRYDFGNTHWTANNPLVKARHSVNAAYTGYSLKALMTGAQGNNLHGFSSSMSYELAPGASYPWTTGDARQFINGQITIRDFNGRSPGVIGLSHGNDCVIGRIGGSIASVCDGSTHWPYFIKIWVK